MTGTNWGRFAAGLVVLIAGCGGDAGGEKLKTAPVSGTLTYQGKPLESFTVTFTPPAAEGRPATGVTDASGNFVLGTNKAGDGAVIGQHKVSVNYAPPPEVDSAVATPIDDPRQYPKADVNIPKKYNNPETSEIFVDVPAGGLKDYKLELQ